MRFGDNANEHSNMSLEEEVFRTPEADEHFIRIRTDAYPSFLSNSPC